MNGQPGRFLRRSRDFIAMVLAIAAGATLFFGLLFAAGFEVEFGERSGRILDTSGFPEPLLTASAFFAIPALLLASTSAEFRQLVGKLPMVGLTAIVSVVALAAMAWSSAQS